MEKLKNLGITIPHLITWIILFAQAIALIVTVEAHLNDNIKHLNKNERYQMEARLNRIENELSQRDIKVREIVRVTIDELKAKGYLK